MVVASHAGEAPSPWVVRFAGLIAPGGAVLDVASGRGRHSRWLEARGHRVTAIDRDAAALAVCSASETIVHDLEAGVDPADRWPLQARRFAAVVVTNYLHRPLFPLLLSALAPGGVLLYETFAAGNARFGKPASPAFLLAPGELLRLCGSLAVVAFEDGLVTTPRPASVQRICAIDDGAPGADAGRAAAETEAGAPRRHAL